MPGRPAALADFSLVNLQGRLLFRFAKQLKIVLYDDSRLFKGVTVNLKAQ